MISPKKKSLDASDFLLKLLYSGNFFLTFYKHGCANPPWATTYMGKGQEWKAVREGRMVVRTGP